MSYGNYPGAELLRMVDAELAEVSRRSSDVAPTPIEEAEALTLIMAKHFAPSLDEKAIRRSLYVNHARLSLLRLNTIAESRMDAARRHESEELGPQKGLLTQAQAPPPPPLDVKTGSRDFGATWRSSSGRSHRDHSNSSPLMLPSSAHVESTALARTAWV